VCYSSNHARTIGHPYAKYYFNPYFTSRHKLTQKELDNKKDKSTNTWKKIQEIFVTELGDDFLYVAYK
jgi:hypothetical protein